MPNQSNPKKPEASLTDRPRFVLYKVPKKTSGAIVTTVLASYVHSRYMTASATVEALGMWLKKEPEFMWLMEDSDNVTDEGEGE